MSLIIHSEKWILQEPEKPQRTHQEIMTNWFKIKGMVWSKVRYFDPKCKSQKYKLYSDRWLSKEEFNDLEMSELPPEE